MTTTQEFNSSTVQKFNESRAFNCITHANLGPLKDLQNLEPLSSFERLEHFERLELLRLSLNR